MENTKTCGLCLEQISNNNLERSNVDTIRNLTNLLNLDTPINEQAVICFKCADVCQESYNFKNACVGKADYLKTFNPPNHESKLILEDVIVKTIKSEMKCEEEKVCRFCLNYIGMNLLVEINVEEDLTLKNMLGRYLPEIDMSIVQDPLICYFCGELLEKLLNFISRCDDAEVLRNLDMKTDIIVDENVSVVSTENDDNINNSVVKKEEIFEDIENPEIIIKSEDSDIDEEVKDSVNDRCKVWKLVSHKIIHRDSSEVKMYKCAECSYETKLESLLKKHERIHARNRENVVKGDIEVKDVQPEPTDKTKERQLVCDVCSYQTHKKFMLKHYLTHKKPSEVNIFKCDYCPFVTKWKKNLTQHAICHKNPSELLKFKCNDCPYKTNKKPNLVRHLLVHKHPSEVVMFKCKVCPYETKYKRNIQAHGKKHEVDIYTCDACNYKTKLKSIFTRHVRYHKEWRQPANQNLNEGRQYKCSECSYVGMRKSLLIQHQLLHKDLSERDMYNCKECSYQVLYKMSLRRHYKTNHPNLEVPFGDLKTFRCNECEFETLYKEGILRHLQAHEQGKRTNEAKKDLQVQDNAQSKEAT